MDLKPHRTLVPAVLATAILAVACSSGGGGSTSATSPSIRSTQPKISATTTTTIVPAIDLHLPTEIEQVTNLPGFDIFRPKDLNAAGRRLPVIVWANGGCVRFNGVWQSLLERWAAAGNIVVAIGTPKLSDPAAPATTTADDQAKAIDWTFHENSRVASPFAGKLDTARVVAAGNSCGGITTMTLAARDRRVRAVFVLSGSSVLPGGSRAAAAAVMRKVRVPIGYITGGPTDISRPMMLQDYAVAAPGVPVYLALRRVGDHVVVSTKPSVLAEVADISTNWLDYVLYGTPRARNNLLPAPCPSCPAGTWAAESKNFEIRPSSS